MGNVTSRAKNALLTCAACCAALSSHSAAWAQPTQAISVPAGPLASTLTEIGNKLGANILFSPDTMRGLRSNPIKGRFSAEEAARAAVRGMPLEVVRDAGGAIIVRQRMPQPAGQPAMIRSSASLAQTAPPAPAPAAPTEPVATPDAEDDSSDPDIVVTGTLIRGIAPAGSSVIGVSREQIESTGAASTTQLLAHVPQVTNFFNALPTVGANAGGGNAGLQINRPNLRNLPPSNSGAQTLILIDGHRIVGAGTTMIAVDPDVVSPSMLERVEAITDGGSAIYGSDAIGGVINFITRRRFDGIEVGARAGFAENYQTYDGNITIGKDWSSGSVFASYAYGWHSALFGYDRDYLKTINWNTGQGTAQTCTPGNIAVSSRVYSLPNLVLGSPNLCDPSIYTTVYPEERRHSVNVGFSQDIGENLEFDIRGLYLHRFNITNGGPFAGFANTTVRPANPYYRNLPGVDANATQSVRFDYSTVFGNEGARQETSLETWQITPTLVAKLGRGWQARALFSYGESTSIFDNLEINATVQGLLAGGTTFATAINPYDINATQNRALLDTLQGHKIGIGRNALTNARLVFDGPLFTLPGGDVRAAAGAEYMKNRFSNQLTNLVTYQLLAPLHYSQGVKSLFGEIQVPFFGDANAIPGFHALSASVSARYDKYSDFGDTFNPKIGVTWEPVDWVSLRGYLGTSFNAPNPAEQLQTLSSALLGLPGGIVPLGTVVPPGSFTILWRAGAVDDLQPQTSRNWSIGAQVNPPFVPGLRLDASYYAIHFKNMLGVPDISNNFANYFTLYPALFIINPSIDQLREIAEQTTAGPAAIAQFLVPNGPRVISLLDIRTRNLGSARLAGLDFSALYRRQTSFGSVDLSVTGNYQLKLDVKGSPLAPYVNTIARGVSRLKISTVVGATIGNFRAQATWNHNAGYDVTRSALLPQDHVSAFNVINLFFRYDVNREGIFKDLSLTLNIDNVLNQDPPVYKLGDGLSRGYANGLTLGRMVQFGISKKF